MGLPNAFLLARTLELDVELGGDPLTLRVEIFRAASEEGVYRARLWRSELFRLTPSFPRDDADEPAHETDDALLVEWAALLDRDYERFHAASEDDAVTRVLAAIETAVARTSAV